MASITEYLQQEYNAKVIGKNEDGSAKISVYDPQLDKDVEQDIDVQGLLKADGRWNEADLKQVPFSSPELPIATNGIGFMQEIDLLTAKTTKDKHRVLAANYGAENTRMDAQGKFTVKKDGEWYTAEDGAIAHVANEALPVTASILGGIAGIPAGPAGIVLGSAGAYTAAKGWQMAEASRRGIRTDLDLETVSSELGKEFMTAVVLEIATPLAIAGVKMAAPLARAPAKYLASKAGAFFGKLNKVVPSNMIGTASDALGQLTNTSKLSGRVAITHPEAVEAAMQSEIKFMDQIDSPEFRAAAQRGDASVTRQLGESPNRQAARETLEDSVRKSVIKSRDMHTDEIMALGPELQTQKVSVDHTASLDGYLQSMVNEKVAERGEDGVFKWIGKSKNAEDRFGQEIVRSKDFSDLKIIFEDMLELKRRAASGSLTFEQLTPVTKKLNTMMEGSKLFEGTELTSSGPTKALMAKARAGLEETKLWAAKEVSKDVAAGYEKAQAGASRRLGLIEDIQRSVDPAKVDGTIQRILNVDGKNAALQNSLHQLLTETGLPANKIFDDLAIANAGIEFAPKFMESRTGWSAVPSMVTGPRMAGNALVKLGKLTNHAKVNKMVSELPQAAKLEMFTNPQANQNIMQLLNIAPITQVQNAQQAVEKVSNAIQTGDLKGVGEDMKRAAKTYGK